MSLKTGGMTNLRGRSRRSFIGSLFENDLKTGEHYPILDGTRLFERALDEHIDLMDMRIYRVAKRNIFFMSRFKFHKKHLTKGYKLIYFA